VRDFQQNVLGVLFCVYLLVVNFNCVSRWEAAVPLDAVKCARTRSERVGRVNSNLAPITREVGIWVSTDPEPGKLVEILENHKVVPPFIGAKVW